MNQPESFRSVLLLVLFLFVTAAFAVQIPNIKSNAENIFQSNENSETKQISIVLPSLSPSPTPELTHNLVAAFYDVETYPNAKLLLNNKGLSAIEIRPTLYNLDGVPMIIAPVFVEANSHRFINLSDWANAGGASFQKGSLKLFHTGKDLIIGSQIYLEDAANSLSFEERLAELGKFDSRRFEAIWAMPRNQTQVTFILSNTSDTTLFVNAKLSKKPHHTGETQTFTLLPHQTRVLDLRQDFADGNQFANSEVVGLSLEHTGEKSALKAHGQIKDAAIGYSNIIAFSNPASGKSSELHGTGLHLGIMGGEELEPVVAIKNVGTARTDVTVKVPYTRTNGTSGTVNLNPVNLKEGEMRLVNMNPVIQRSRQEQIQIAGIELTHAAAPGSIIVQAQSLSQSKNQVYRVPMADPLAQTSSTGGYPFRIEETSRTVSYIKNMTDLEQNYIAYLTWDGDGEYMFEQDKLAPHKTIEIDVKKLRDEQTPDERGRTIPLNVTSGQIKWTLRQKYQTDNPKNDKYALIGRSEQIDMVNDVSSSYACQNCCSGGVYDAFVTTDISGLTIPGNYDFEVGDFAQFYAFVRIENCYGERKIKMADPSDWDSSNNSIATVNSTGGVEILAVGDVEIDADIEGVFYVEVDPCPLPLTTDIFSEKPEKETKEENPSSVAPCGSCDTYTINFEPEADIAVRKLEILRNGQVISNMNSPIQNVVVGERIDLTTRLVSGSTTIDTATMSNRQWTIPGTRIANYVVTYTSSTAPSSGVLTELTSQNLTQSSIQFYWVDGADSRNIQYSARMGNKTYTGNARFNVKRPTVSVTSVTHTTTIYTTGQHQELLFGATSVFGTQTPGISFSRTNFQVPTGFSGDSFWVQTINFSFTRTLADGQTTQTSSATGLDNKFPYSSRDPNAPSTNDLPGVCLRVCGEDFPSIIRMQANINADMWLMFKPNGNNSIYVPLKKVSWNWSAVAIRGADFLFVKPEMCCSNSENPSGADTTSFPQWTKVVTGNEPYE
jgi:hypothetical protein